jgi:hypothetical protein
MWASGLLLSACGKPTDPNDLPVSHWLNDAEDCTRASATAILKSGLPYPNFGTEQVKGVGKEPGAIQRIKTVDMWLGPTRFVIPAAVASSSLYPLHHPRHFEGMRGTLPNFYPPGPPADEIYGMGGSVDVFFTCSMDEEYVASWGKGYKSNAEGIEKIKADYESQLAVLPDYPGEVTVNRREDLGMIEVLMERRTKAGEWSVWRASYWPVDRELKGPDGSVSAIRCDARHDPEGRHYGGAGWRCSAGIRFIKHATARIDIYVSHIRQMPGVFDQVLALLSQAQQSSKE